MYLKNKKNKKGRNTHGNASIWPLFCLWTWGSKEWCWVISALVSSFSIIAHLGVFSLLSLSAFQWFKLCDFLSVYFVKWNAFIKSCTQKCSNEYLNANSTAQGKGFTIYQWEVSWDSEAEDFTAKICVLFFFFPGNLFYKKVSSWV